MDDATGLWLTVGLLGVAAVFTAGLLAFLYWRFHMRRIGSAPVEPDGAFELRATAPSARTYRICVRYEVAYEGTRSHYGIVLYLQTKIDGHPEPSEVVAVGYDVNHVQEVPNRFSTTEFFASHSRRGMQHERSATVEVARVSCPRAGAEIVVAGRNVSAPDTKVKSLELFVA